MEMTQQLTWPAVINAVRLFYATCFWRRVDRRSKTECWNFKGRRNHDGYGRSTFRGFGYKKRRFAHRVAFGFVNGPAPNNLLVCHRCDNPACCNPDHLFLGTRNDNNQDKITKGRMKLGEQLPQTKLTAEKVRKIRSYLPRQCPIIKLAKEYGVSPHTIRYVMAGSSWKHLT